MTGIEGLRLVAMAIQKAAETAQTRVLERMTFETDFESIEKEFRKQLRICELAIVLIKEQKREILADLQNAEQKEGTEMCKPNEATEKLLKLAAENPSLPIVAMVNYEVVAGDDFSYWTGEICDVGIEELWSSQADGRIWAREDAEDEFDHFVASNAPNEDLVKIECLTDGKMYEQAAMEWIAGLPWTKCIVIFVETPDELTKKETLK